MIAITLLVLCILLCKQDQNKTYETDFQLILINQRVQKSKYATIAWYSYHKLFNLSRSSYQKVILTSSKPTNDDQRSGCYAGNDAEGKMSVYLSTIFFLIVVLKSNQSMRAFRHRLKVRSLRVTEHDETQSNQNITSLTTCGTLQSSRAASNLHLDKF